MIRNPIRQIPVPPAMETIENPYGLHKGQNWKNIAEDCAREVKNIMQRKKRPNEMDTSDVMLKRRQQAAVRSADQIVKRYENQKTFSAQYQSEVGKRWVLMNLIPLETYNRIEVRSYILCGAAIWILDQITCQPNWREALFPVLPRKDEDLWIVNTPNIWDVNYEEELIYSVVYVLQQRNSDIEPISYGKEIPNVLTDEVTARGRQHVDVPSRRAFEALMALIPQQAVEQAIRNFEDLFWQWVDRYFECMSSLSDAYNDALQEVNQIALQFNETREELIRAISAVKNNEVKEREQERKRHKGGNRQPGSLLAQQPSLQMRADRQSQIQNLLSDAQSAPYLHRDALRPLQPISETGAMQLVMDITDRLIEINQEHNDALDDLDATSLIQHRFESEIAHDGYIHRYDCDRQYGDAVAKRMTPLVVADPFESCFALLWLIDRDSDLPWLYGAGCSLMQEIVEGLPWGIKEYCDPEEAAWEDGAQEDDEEDFEEETSDEVEDTPDPEQSIPEADTQEEIKTAPPLSDWFERKFKPRSKYIDISNRRSLAQVVYEETGCVLPREMDQYDDYGDTVRRYGVKGKDVGILLNLFTVLSQVREQKTALNLDDEIMRYFCDEEDDLRQEDAQQDTETIQDQIKSLREENKRLRSSLYNAERANRETKKELSSQREIYAREHLELSDLREIMFRQSAQKETEEDVTEADTKQNVFPYEVKLDTVIFGGHESWLKAIRPMLTGNIRFVNKDSVFDQAIVRNADRIWIQTNAMSHKQYWRVIDVARQYRKQVRYFTCSGATKSAEQIMSEDQSE